MSEEQQAWAVAQHKSAVLWWVAQAPPCSRVSAGHTHGHSKPTVVLLLTHVGSGDCRQYLCAQMFSSQACKWRQQLQGPEARHAAAENCTFLQGLLGNTLCLLLPAPSAKMQCPREGGEHRAGSQAHLCRRRTQEQHSAALRVGATGARGVSEGAGAPQLVVDAAWHREHIQVLGPAKIGLALRLWNRGRGKRLSIRTAVRATNEAAGGPSVLQ